ncbi:MAG: hypothetical protein Q8O00_00230 [Holophaga sp.]|nr:hypothetical protein [Holophaga sp.]
MIQHLVLASMLGLSQAQLPVGEPDGSRTIGIVPPFTAEPAPPGWLRSTSHALTSGTTRHYIYEAYAGPKNQWLVRYRMLPGAEEGTSIPEQAFLFSSNTQKRPQKLNLRIVRFEGRMATWKKHSFALVDHRDLMKP